MKQAVSKKSSLGDLLITLRRNITEGLRKEGLTEDLTFSQVEVLKFIGESGKETMKSIADYLKITPPSTTEIIKEMERKGLVKREGDKKDRRIVSITLTSRAQTLLHSALKRKEVILKKMISKLQKKDRESLERIIRVLITE